MKSVLRYVVFFLVASTLQCAAYDPSTAFQLVHFSNIVYVASTAEINSWSCNSCKQHPLQNTQVIENIQGGIKGYSGYSPTLKTIVVSFRGSKNLMNWFLNLSATKVGYDLCSKCSVHSGFLIGYNLVRTQVKSSILKLIKIYPTAKIMVTGHSLGGALAVLAAVDLHLAFNKIDSVYTYGQPRLGNSILATNIQKWIPNYFRVVHSGDIVPHNPGKIIGYTHGGAEIWYKSDMQSYKSCAPESNACSNSLSFWKLKFNDHLMSGYLKLKASGGKTSHAIVSYGQSSWAYSIEEWLGNKMVRLTLKHE